MPDHHDYAALFEDMHPGFFQREYIRAIPEGEIYDEMILPLDQFDAGKWQRKFGPDVSFGFFEGEKDLLHQAVASVIPEWLPYYDGKHRVYCGYIDGRIASFCLVEDMGVHPLQGRAVKIGGPGCVGSVPEFRNRGIGLTMVNDVTRILKEEGYGLSYIHYTGVAPWYKKLGYRTVLRWTRDGILAE